MLEHFRRFDWVLFGAVLAIALMGLVIIHSIAEHQEKAKLVFQKQILTVAAGLAALVLVSFFDYRLFRNWSWPSLILYLAAAGLLIAVLVFGKPIRGSRSWFFFGGFGFQPVEAAKLALLIILAKYFSTAHIEIYRWKHILISGLYFLLLFFLVLLQPDVGSALILFALWVGMMLIAGIGWRKLAVLAIAAIFSAALAWGFLFKPYQKSRIISFLNPKTDPLGSSYNAQQALIAVGSGGWLGKGLRQASQTQYGFLPEATNDFIVAALAETWGFVGLGALFGLWTIICVRVIKIGAKTINNFGRLYGAGLLIVLIVHFLFNGAVNLGLLPIIGLSSPFLSAGGSQFLAFAIGLGLLQNIRIAHS